MKKWAARAAFLTLITFFGLTLVSRQVLAATTKVSPSNMNGWAFQVQSPDGSGTFVSGPTGQPVGVGSARLFTGTHGNLGTAIHNTSYVNVKLSDITSLSYSTYSVSTGTTSSKYPFLLIDVTTPLGHDELSFDPINQSQAPLLNTWQNWDAHSGVWRSNSFSQFNGTLSQYIAGISQSPGDITIVNRLDATGGVRLAAGPASTPDVFDENVDNFIINTGSGDTTYDFDPDSATNSFTPTFFNSTDFTGTAQSGASLAQLKYNWGTGQPVAGVGPTNWSGKFGGTFDTQASKYRFDIVSDGDTRVIVDGVEAIHKTINSPAQFVLNLTAGVHDVKVEYIHTISPSANLKLTFWKTSQCYDMNADNIMNSADLAIVASHFASTGPLNPWDVDGNGTVNSGDLAILASKFNQTCPF